MFLPKRDIGPSCVGGPQRTLASRAYEYFGDDWLDIMDVGLVRGLAGSSQRCVGRPADVRRKEQV